MTDPDPLAQDSRDQDSRDQDLADIVAQLTAAGRPGAAAVAPSLLSYHRALRGWRGLARTTLDPHTWPAHTVEPVTRSRRS